MTDNEIYDVIVIGGGAAGCPRRSYRAARDADGWVVTDPNGLTSIDDVWAIGNIVDQRAQVVIAAAQGSSAATAVDRDLLAEDVARATEKAA